MLSWGGNTVVEACVGLGWSLGIEKGLTRDRRTESRLGHLTGRGNRRPEVIRDDMSRRRKWGHTGSPH